MDAPDDQREFSSTLSPELGVMEYSGIASTSSLVSLVRHEDEEGEEEEDDDAEFEPVRNEPFSFRDWIYFLNEGSEMNISMTVMSSSSLPLELAIGEGGIAVLIFLVFRLRNCCRHVDNRPEAQYRRARSERAPLLSPKDDDQSSCTSSSDFVSQDDERVLDMLEGQSKDGGTDLSISRLCAICFDAPRDCFFLPCGHCVACLACGMR
ncbi:hypothetical protein AgCh_026916 [Apium graveolens]